MVENGASVFWQRTDAKQQTSSGASRWEACEGRQSRLFSASCYAHDTQQQWRSRTNNNNGEQHLQLLYHGGLIQSFHLMYHLLSSVVNSCCITKHRRNKEHSLTHTYRSRRSIINLFLSLNLFPGFGPPQLYPPRPLRE